MPPTLTQPASERSAAIRLAALQLPVLPRQTATPPAGPLDGATQANPGHAAPQATPADTASQAAPPADRPATADTAGQGASHATAADPAPQATPTTPPAGPPRRRWASGLNVAPLILLAGTALAFAGLAHLGTAAHRQQVTDAAVLDFAVGPTDQAFLHGAGAVRVPAALRGAAAAARPARGSRSRSIPAVAAATGPLYVRPDVGPLTSPFGMRWGRLHPGIDLAGPYGSPVRAVTDGVVVSTGTDGGYGNLIVLRHADGTQTAYAHLSAILTVAGSAVTAGQTIGLEGSTGFSTGPHLHFEVRIGGVPVDPLPWLRARGVSV